jgi:8-oxo-dGTP pyrophosphatase MutT (NUDIX family)
MPTPQFVLELRQKLGHEPLWLATAMGVVLDEDGLVLLGRRADNGMWTLPGGIIDPGELPADAAAREVFEETGIAAVPEVLSSVGVSPQITYLNGDKVQYLEFCFRCRPVGGEAGVNDGECSEVGWFALDTMPDLGARTRELIITAIDGNSAAFTFSGLSDVLGQPT